MGNIKEKLKASGAKLARAVEAQKETLVTKLVESNAWVVVFKWLVTHWVTVLLASSFLIFYAKTKYDKYLLEDALIQQELQTLNTSLEDLRKQRDALLKQITQFNKKVEDAKKENIKIRKQASSLTLEQKKEKILNYKERLIKQRGIK